MRIQADGEWEDFIMGGGFEAIPDPFRFRNSFRFAYLIDGYEVAGGFEPLAALAATTAQAAGAAGRWFGDPATLWLTLFFEHRRYRHYGAPPEGDAEASLDALCQTLRGLLVAIPADERAAFLATLAPAATS
ncbi:MAG: hypothetical protein V4466_01345 [Pseudomonadota bacterium]